MHRRQLFELPLPVPLYCKIADYVHKLRVDVVTFHYIELLALPGFS